MHLDMIPDHNIMVGDYFWQSLFSGMPDRILDIFYLGNVEEMGIIYHNRYLVI